MSSAAPTSSTEDGAPGPTVAPPPKTLEQQLASYVPAHVALELAAACEGTSQETQAPTMPERHDFEVRSNLAAATAAALSELRSRLTSRLRFLRSSQGAVAFVDISGFTKLSETLKQQHGKGGSEKLNVYINAYFEQLIREVSKFHGDVIEFAGDALQARARSAPAAVRRLAAAARSHSARRTQARVRLLRHVIVRMHRGRLACVFTR